jgi:signal transduction histidine kinase
LADRQVLRQALINLVDNAIKFTPIGGTVRILLSETPAEAICDVEDGGHGIAPEAQAHIFDRFFRAGDATPGTGLGLSIAKRAVEANGGHLTLHSSGPNGSTFRLTVPRRVPAH